MSHCPKRLLLAKCKQRLQKPGKTTLGATWFILVISTAASSHDVTILWEEVMAIAGTAELSASWNHSRTTARASQLALLQGHLKFSVHPSNLVVLCKMPDILMAH